jgi:hypothetical protein
MVNFGLNSASILGIVIAVAGAGLYFLRSLRPELSRDHDIFFAAIGLLCGFILIFQGWRLDPILQFGQFLLTGAAMFFAFETIRLRGATTEQAKRTGRSPVMDDDDYRPVSNAYTYTAELDELEAVEDYPSKRRLRGSTERRSSRTEEAERDQPRRRSRPDSPRRRSDDWDAPPRRPTRPEQRRDEYTDGYDDYRSYGSDYGDDYSQEPPPPRPSRNRPESDLGEDYPAKPRRNSPPPEDYVDYQPIDQEEDDEGPRGTEY